MQKQMKRNGFMPNCVTSFKGFGNDKTMLQTFTPNVRLKYRMADGSCRIYFGRHHFGFRKLTVTRWIRLVWLIDLCVSIRFRTTYVREISREIRVSYK